MLPLVSAHFDEGIMAFFDVDSEKVLAGKVFAAFQASIGVETVVMGFVFSIGGEDYRFMVRR